MAVYFGILLIPLIILFLLAEGISQQIREIQATSIVYQQYQGEILQWRLQAKELVKKGDSFFSVKELYLENPAKGLRISADEGIYLRQEDKFILKGKVRLYAEREGEIHADELLFYPKRNLIEIPGAVRVRKGDLEIRGEGLTYQINLGELRVHRRAQAQFRF